MYQISNIVLKLRFPDTEVALHFFVKTFVQIFSIVNIVIMHVDDFFVSRVFSFPCTFWADEKTTGTQKL